MPEKPVGWRRESARHGLAAKGIKTGRKANPSTATAPRRKPISFSEDNWGFEDDGKNLKVRLGNWTTAGWHWDGNEDEMVGFLVRMSKAGHGVREQFLEAMKKEGVDFKAYRHILLAAARDGDGLYEASGDNALWHFGEGSEPDEEALNDDARNLAEDWGWSQEKIDEYIEDQGYWTYSNPDNDYDTYAEEVGDDWASDIKERIEMADSWEEFMDDISSEDFAYDWRFEELGGYHFYEMAYYSAGAEAMLAWEQAKKKEGS